MSDDEKLTGIIFPLPMVLISRIFEENKNVFTKYTTHPITRLQIGNKLFLYQSKSGKIVVGEAIIEKIGFMLPKDALNQYSEKLIISPEEMPLYVRDRASKKMLVLELKNIRRYSKPIHTKIPMTMAGQYVTEENQKDIFDI